MNDVFNTALADHARLATWIAGQVPLLRKIGQIIVDALATGHRLYLIGNGGSAADAQHIAAEMVGRFKRQRQALPAIALTTDTSNLLAIGNDFGFDEVFKRQIEAFVQPGDVVWALSTSGNSPNVNVAVEAARKRQACVIGFTGLGGGRLKPLCDYCFQVDHPTSDRIQETHQLAYHIICDFVEQSIAVG